VGGRDCGCRNSFSSKQDCPPKKPTHYREEQQEDDYDDEEDPCSMAFAAFAAAAAASTSSSPPVRLGWPTVHTISMCESLHSTIHSIKEDTVYYDSNDDSFFVDDDGDDDDALERLIARASEPRHTKPELRTSVKLQHQKLFCDTSTTPAA